MLKESSIIHVEGLSLTVRPNVKETEGKQSLYIYNLPRYNILYTFDTLTI